MPHHRLGINRRFEFALNQTQLFGHVHKGAPHMCALSQELPFSANNQNVGIMHSQYCKNIYCGTPLTDYSVAAIVQPIK